MDQFSITDAASAAVGAVVALIAQRSKARGELARVRSEHERDIKRIEQEREEAARHQVNEVVDHYRDLVKDLSAEIGRLVERVNQLEQVVQRHETEKEELRRQVAMLKGEQ